MTPKKWLIRAATFGLVILTAAGLVAVAASYGSSSDPLVSLSYITDVLKPDILGQVDTKIDSESETLKSEMANQISDFTDEIDSKINGISGGGGTSSTYSVVSLASGKTLTGTVGTEVMLRIGTAICVSPSSPGLIDSTDGSILESGSSLVKNHLYMITIEGRGIKATAAVKVLVRGSYTIS